MSNLNFNIIYDRRNVASASRPATLEARFTLNRKQKYFSLGIRILPNQWDSREGKIVRHPEKNELNQRLVAVRAK